MAQTSDGAGNRGAGNSDEQRRQLQSTKDRLRELGERLETARGPEIMAPEKRSSAMGQAFRLATELVVGIVVGVFIGWWIDRFFETTPVFILVFFVLGVIAGIMNVLRTAKKMQAENPPTGTALPEDDEDEN